MTASRDPGPLGRDDAHLDGRVAIVTGAARGVGRAVVGWLHTRGVQVLATDLRPELVELAARYPGVVTLDADVTREDTGTRSVTLARERFGRLDILVNNAGRTINKPLVDTEPADWDALLDVNARAAFLHTRAAFEAMSQSGAGGSIVNVGSYACTVGLPLGVAYSASKGALAQLTKVTALEGGPHGIRANVVAPGVIDTDILGDARDDARAYLRTFGPAHALGRIAGPHEIAEVIGFLASDRASFVTGAVLAVDGGFTAA